MHESTYGYLNPTGAQKETLGKLRSAAADYGRALEVLLPEGPDKIYAIRHHRQTAMWANVAATRLSDGTPRP